MPDTPENQPAAYPQKIRRGTKPNGRAAPDAALLRVRDNEILDEYEKLERENILDEETEPEDADEPSIIEVVDRAPKWTGFRVNPATVFDMWGIVNQEGMDKTVIVVTKEFAPELEAEEVELRRVRFYETVTTDGIVRLVYVMVPDKSAQKPNTWLVSKRDALEHGKTAWTTMASRKKLGKFTYKKCRKDHGEPRFSGYSIGQLIQYGLRKPGLLVEDDTHSFYRKVAELDDE
jgi:hypothetical protein